METTAQRLERLFNTGNWSKEDRDWLKDYLEKGDLEALRLLALEQFSGNLLQKKAYLDQKLSARLLENIHNRIQMEPHQAKRYPLTWKRMAVAASVILAVTAGSYWLLHTTRTRTQTAQNQPQDIAPGRNQATLTLASGQKIILKKGFNGQLAQQGAMLVQVNNGKAIAYTASDANPGSSPVLYNTLSTKRGEQSPYPLLLADGTKVWLDAASSITFPAQFSGSDRTVKITGQAWFEVAHDAAHPFKVAVKGLLIEDIGTTFNINAYDDELRVSATLVSGAVRVSGGTAQQVMLKPGQQAVLKNNSLSVQRADIEDASAWHNGLFAFHDADIPTVMRQLSRWYDVEVSYEGNIPDLRFSGNIYRNNTVLKVSDILSYEKIHFRIEGKKIIVEP